MQSLFIQILFIVKNHHPNIVYLHYPIGFWAVRGGIGHMGYSGLIITKEYGSSIALASVVTNAKLKPTKSLERVR